MKSLYISSIERFSGKTAVCLGLGKRFQADGYSVGYLKPVSLQPHQSSGHVEDVDASFVKEILGLDAKPWELSPIVLTPGFLRERLQAPPGNDLLEKVKVACESAAVGRDVLLLEGGATLREGHMLGLPTAAVAAAVGSKVLMIVNYLDEIRVLDDGLATQTRLGDTLGGILINRVPASAHSFAAEAAAPFLESRGIPVLGLLPEARGLASLTVEELVEVLDAEIITRYYRPQTIVENLTVGAMTAESALNRFRKYSHKAVITGGDRTDVILAALETSTACLVLTGNLTPSPLVLKQAEEFGVAVLLVHHNTMETIQKIESIYGKTRLGQAAKLRQFQNLLNDNLNFTRLYEILGLK